MPLSYRDKQSFYHGLAQLIRTGTPFPKALEKLVPHSRGAVGRLLQALRASLAQGLTVGEAFAGQGSGVSALEVSILGAVEKSGQLDHGLRELAGYFGALDQARRAIVRRCVYPLFLLHFGIPVLNLPTLVLKDTRTFWTESFGTLIYFYSAAAIVAMLAPLLRDAGATNPAIDGLLGTLPLLGKVRRAFALSRFCTVYGLQLEAGVNVFDALSAAGRASRSGRIRNAVAGALPEVRQGAQVGPQLAISGAFPEEFSRALIVAEETGALDVELRRMAAELRSEALGTLDILAEWLPKLIYLLAVVFLGWRILEVIQKGIVAPYQEVLKDF